MILKIPTDHCLNPVGLAGQTDRDHCWSAAAEMVVVGEVLTVVAVG